MRRAEVAPSAPAFTAIVAAAMATTALSIDIMLPAFGDIRADLGLPADSPRVSGLLTAFFLGLAIAQVPMGVLSDRFGRKPVLWLGVALFVAGSVMTALADSLGLMLAGRFLWGVGSAGPRVVAVAMVRDTHEGAAMAKKMSFVMATFILVPVVAPAIGAGVVHVASWRWVFGVCAVFGVLLAAAATLLPETLATERRRPLSLRPTVGAAKAVLTERRTVVHGLALTSLFSVFAAYLGGIELIVDDVWGLDAWFPVIFGGVAVAMGVCMFLNGRVVEAVGLDRVIRVALLVYLAAAGGLVALALATDGTPSFATMALPLTLVLCCHGLLIPNLNAAAMEPLGAAAGMGSALLGTVSTAVGAVIAAQVDRAYDDTVRPLVFGFLLAGILASLAVRTSTAASTPV
jgi:MFS transporter, DHA1 family, multidrug resistance protein